MKAPQIIYVVWLALSVGISLARHGKPKMGNESFWGALLGVAIQIGLLLWGGFFN